MKLWLKIGDSIAQDLRASVKSVARLSFAPDKLLDYLIASEPKAANDPKDSDHTVFWLTVADQPRDPNLPPRSGPLLFIPLLFF